MGVYILDWSRLVSLLPLVHSVLGVYLKFSKHVKLTARNVFAFQANICALLKMHMEQLPQIQCSCANQFWTTSKKSPQLQRLWKKGNRSLYPARHLMASPNLMFTGWFRYFSYEFWFRRYWLSAWPASNFIMNVWNMSIITNEAFKLSIWFV